MCTCFPPFDFPLSRSISRTYYGAILGVYSVLGVMSLQAAIFWGQYSSCEKLQTASINFRRLANFEGVRCDDTGAMTALCVFAAILFLLHISFCFLLFRFKDNILGF